MGHREGQPAGRRRRRGAVRRLHSRSDRPRQFHRRVTVIPQLFLHNQYLYLHPGRRDPRPDRVPGLPRDPGRCTRAARAARPADHRLRGRDRADHDQLGRRDLLHGRGHDRRARPARRRHRRRCRRARRRTGEPSGCCRERLGSALATRRCSPATTSSSTAPGWRPGSPARARRSPC